MGSIDAGVLRHHWGEKHGGAACEFEVLQAPSCGCFGPAKSLQTCLHAEEKNLSWLVCLNVDILSSHS